MRRYHGTSRPGAVLAAYREGRLCAGSAHRRRDPGDFGSGFYCTTVLARARSYGQRILTVQLDTSRFAHIANPYFLDGLEEVMPNNHAERLMHGLVCQHGRYRTVWGTEKWDVADEIRREFLASGYEGIYTDYQGDAVVFVQRAITALELLSDT